MLVVRQEARDLKTDEVNVTRDNVLLQARRVTLLVVLG